MLGERRHNAKKARVGDVAARLTKISTAISFFEICPHLPIGPSLVLLTPLGHTGLHLTLLAPLVRQGVPDNAGIRSGETTRFQYSCEGRFLQNNVLNVVTFAKIKNIVTFVIF